MRSALPDSSSLSLFASISLSVPFTLYLSLSLSLWKSWGIKPMHMFTITFIFSLLHSLPFYVDLSALSSLPSYTPRFLFLSLIHAPILSDSTSFLFHSSFLYSLLSSIHCARKRGKFRPRKQFSDVLHHRNILQHVLPHCTYTQFYCIFFSVLNSAWGIALRWCGRWRTSCWSAILPVHMERESEWEEESEMELFAEHRCRAIESPREIEQQRSRKTRSIQAEEVRDRAWVTRVRERESGADKQRYKRRPSDREYGR